MAVTYKNGVLSIFRVDTEQVLQSFRTDLKPIFSIAWNAIGTTLASIGKDAKLNIIKPQQIGQAVLSKLLTKAKSGTVMFVNKGTMILVAGIFVANGLPQPTCALYEMEYLNEVGRVTLEMENPD